MGRSRAGRIRYVLHLDLINSSGIAYMVKDNAFHFNLTSLFLKQDVFETCIHEAVEEMRVVFEATIPVKAKL